MNTMESFIYLRKKGMTREYFINYFNPDGDFDWENDVEIRDYADFVKESGIGLSTFDKFLKLINKIIKR